VEKFIAPGKGRGHVLRVVRECLFFEPEHTGTDLVAALEFARRVVKRRAVTFLLSDFLVPGRSMSGSETGLPEPLRRALGLANRRHDLVALWTTDPRERELPDVGFVTVDDAETGEQLEVDTSSPELRRRYAEAAAAQAEELRQALRGCGVDLLELDTQEPYLPALERFFRGRARRAA
jgi:uncharacterized protein (DUF58 family)